MRKRRTAEQIASTLRQDQNGSASSAVVERLRSENCANSAKRMPSSEQIVADLIFDRKMLQDIVFRKM